MLAPQNFWGAMQSQGAPNIQGDAYMTKYDTRTSTTNTQFDARPTTTSTRSSSRPAPPTARSGSSTRASATPAPTRGTGENWTVGRRQRLQRRASRSARSTDLYDTNNTPYDTSDDTQRRRRPATTLPSAVPAPTTARPDRTPTDCSSADLAPRLVAASGSGLAGRQDVPPPHLLDRLQRPERPAQRDGPQRVRLLGEGHRRHAAGLRPRRHGGLRPPARRTILGVLPGPDRGRACRQDDDHRALGPWRHRLPGGEPPDPRPRRRPTTPSRLQLHRQEGLGSGVGLQQPHGHERRPR